MTITLPIEVRDQTRTVTAIRTAGFIPAVVYGPKQSNIALQVERGAFEKMFKSVGESTIVTLAGLATPIEVLVHSVNFNPMKGGIEHVDFYAIERGKEMTTDVALTFIGESPLEKTGGLVNKVLHEIEVTCLPNVLPAHIDVDVSVLVAVDQKIHVSDLVLPKGVVTTAAADDVVAIAAEGGSEEESEAEEEVPAA